MIVLTAVILLIDLSHLDEVDETRQTNTGDDRSSFIRRSQSIRCRMLHS